MNSQEIPGFCWDPEKKKYFRIQANHVAPTGSQYSEQAVKRRKYDSEVQKHREDVEKRIRLQRVQKSPHLTNPNSRITTEIGNGPIRGYTQQSRQGKAFVNQLELQGDGYNWEKMLPSGTVADFAQYDESGILLVAVNDGWNKCHLLVCPSFEQYRKQKGFARLRSFKFVDNYSAQFSSLSLSDSGVFLATVDNIAHGHSTLVTGFVGNVRMSGDRVLLNDVCLRDSGEHATTMWCSAAQPSSGNDPIFAIGTSDGLYTLNAELSAVVQADIKLPKVRRKRNASKDVDLLALDWLSPTVIATGFRNSLLGLYDVRSRGFATRIKHPGSIGQVKRVDENRLVVAGYRSMQMYDLRYPNKRGLLSNPCLVFDGYDSGFWHHIDLSCELGLVASVTDLEKVRFNSLADGSCIPIPRSVSEMSARNRIMFDNQGHYPRLLVSHGASIDEWSW